jgi:hypothetical protein
MKAQINAGTALVTAEGNAEEIAELVRKLNDMKPQFTPNQPFQPQYPVKYTGTADWTYRPQVMCGGITVKDPDKYVLWN